MFKRLLKLSNFALFWPSVTLFLCSCGSISINSTPPDAEIKAKIVGMADVPLGTPKTFDLKKLEEKNIPPPYLLEVSKEGYAPQLIYIGSKIGKDIQLNITLKPLYNYSDINKLIGEVLAAEEELNKENFKGALKLAESLTAKYPEIIIPYTLAGIAQLKMGQLIESKRSLEKALQLDEKQPKVVQLMNKVQEAMGKKQSKL